MYRPLTSSDRSSSVDSDIWRILSWLGVACQALAAGVAWWSNDLGGVRVILAFLAGSVIFLLAAHRLPSLLAFVAILAAAVNAGGWAWNWYDAVVWFDEFVHTFSPLSIVAVLMFWANRAGWIEAQPASREWVLLAAGSGLVLGIAWEILEAFFLDLRFWDTVMDLLCDTAGAILGGLLSGWVIQRQADAQGAVRTAAGST